MYHGLVRNALRQDDLLDHIVDRLFHGFNHLKQQKFFFLRTSPKDLFKLFFRVVVLRGHQITPDKGIHRDVQLICDVDKKFEAHLMEDDGTLCALIKTDEGLAKCELAGMDDAVKYFVKNGTRVVGEDAEVPWKMLEKREAEK